MHRFWLLNTDVQRLRAKLLKSILRMCAQIFYILFLVNFVAACGGKAASPSNVVNKDPRQKTINSFFSDIVLGRSAGSGVWQADKGDLERFVQDNFIRSYQPKPKENSKTVTQSLLRDSAMFFRIEGSEVGQLFVVKGYNLTVSAGDLLMINQKKQIQNFTMMLNKKGFDGKIRSETSQMSYNAKIDSWVWIVKARQIKLSRVTREPQSLSKEYGDSFSTSLQAY